MSTYRGLSKESKIVSVSILGLVIYATLLLFFFTPGIMVNDDVAMMSFANGDFTGKPEFQLVFIGALIGLILKTLYTLHGNLPWYPIVLATMQILSSTLLILVICKASKFRLTREVICSLALVILYMPVLLLDISFSTTAMYCAVIGIVTISFSVDLRRGQNPSVFVAGGLVLLFASSLRFDFLLFAFAFLAPTILLGLHRGKRKKILFLGLMLPLFLVHLVEREVATSGAWSEYSEFNAVRGSMHGTPAFSAFASSAYSAETTSKTNKFGWNPEDLRLFGNWYFEDQQIFNVSTLRALKENIDVGPVYLPIQMSLENITQGREFLILMGLIIALIGIVPISDGKARYVVLQISWFAAMAIYVSSRYRFPDRIALGALFGASLALIAISLQVNDIQDIANTGQKSSNTKTKVVNAVLISICVSLFFPYKFSTRAVSDRNRNESNTFLEQKKSLSEINNEAKFVYIGAQITAEGINPWRDRTLFAGFSQLGLGWNSQSPHQEKRKKLMGLDGKFINRLIDQPFTYLVTTPETADLIRVSYLRRLGINLEMRSIRETAFGTVYQLLSGRAKIVSS
jgi:hypothetical protein